MATHSRLVSAVSEYTVVHTAIVSRLSAVYHLLAEILSSLVCSAVCVLANPFALGLLQVPACKSRLDSGDVFMLDMGLTIYQWNGTGASMFERNMVCFRP